MKESGTVVLGVVITAILLCARTNGEGSGHGIVDYNGVEGGIIEPELEEWRSNMSNPPVETEWVPLPVEIYNFTFTMEATENETAEKPQYGFGINPFLEETLVVASSPNIIIPHIIPEPESENRMGIDSFRNEISVISINTSSVPPKKNVESVVEELRDAENRSLTHTDSTLITTAPTVSTKTNDDSRFLGINPFINNPIPPILTTELVTDRVPTTHAKEATTTHETATDTTTTQDTDTDTTPHGENSNTTTKRTTTPKRTDSILSTTAVMTTVAVTNVAVQNVTIITTRMCGYPAICDQAKCRDLDIRKDPLEMCEIAGAKAGFIFIIVVIALAIVIGNLLLPLVVWRNRDLRTPHNMMKVSLAVADIITGLILLFSVIPNVIRTMQSTENELAENDKLTKNSAHAVIAGAMLTLSAQASLLHLTYLSIERFVAIKWPLWHRYKGPKSLSSQVAGIWIVSLITSCLPAAFKDAFSFRYIPVLFVYIMTAESGNGGTIYLAIAIAVPFATTVLTTIVTGAIVWRKMRSSAHMQRYASKYRRGNSAKDADVTGYSEVSMRRAQAEREASRKELKPEIAVFKTTIIMIAGFCLTILPIIVAINLFYSGYYNCSTYVIPYVASFYASTTNSFVNVLIYTVRDPKFRAALRGMFKKDEEWSAQKTVKVDTNTNTSTLSNPVAPSPRITRVGEGRGASGKERWERALVGK